MTLADYDKRMTLVNEMRDEASKINDEAYRLERATYREAGLRYRDRGPGFGCWSHADVKWYYDTPEEVMKELEKLLPKRGKRAIKKAGM